MPVGAQPEADAQAPASDTVVETQAEQPVDLDELEQEEDWQEPAPLRRNIWLPVLAIVTVAAWTAFFAWANWDELRSGAGPSQWVDWIAAWAVPVLLVVCMWLLTLRNSRREATRYGEAARALAFESARLEERLTATNRELSLAREFLHAQSRELESLGRVAVDRVGSSADRLQALVQDNARQVESIAAVSTTALENMERLRAELPVVANAARDSASQIGQVGHTAQGQLNELVDGFHRLNEFGSASERQIDSLKLRVDDALDGFQRRTDALGEVANRRFDLLRGQTEKFRNELDGHEVEAEAAIRRRADALRDELSQAREALDDQELEAIGSLRARIVALRDEGANVSGALRAGEEAALGTWRAAAERLTATLREALHEVSTLDERATSSARARLDELMAEATRVDAVLAERAAAFTDDIDARREAHEAHLARVGEAGDALAERLELIEDRLAAAGAQGEAHGEAIAAHARSIADRLGEARSQMDDAGAAMEGLTDASVRLLELIRAGAQHTQNELPAALHGAEERLNALSQEVRETALMLGQSRQSGEDLSAYLLASREQAGAAGTEIEALQVRLAGNEQQHLERLQSWRGELDDIDARTAMLARQSEDRLAEAVAGLDDAITRAVTRLGDDGAEAVMGFAEQIGARSSAAIGAALTRHSAEIIADLEQAAHRAGEASRSVAGNLRDQLAKINELTGNLEHRVAEARAQAEERTDNDFARRVALITESLNSNAIDLSKALSNEVTDTAWASYLKGDRGIFTRRAVRLLDKDESRSIAEIYEEDQDFREHVARYIHDFEAMLRTLLSTRDGNALAVTLLSSDMGKLYVALAQSIERLRD